MAEIGEPERRRVLVPNEQPVPAPAPQQPVRDPEKVP